MKKLVTLVETQGISQAPSESNADDAHASGMTPDTAGEEDC